MLFTNPLWATKTRIVLHFESREMQLRGYSLFAHTVRDMWENEGIRAFFKGFLPGLMLSVYGIIQMTVYENLNYLVNYTEQNKKEKGSLVPFLTGGTSKCTASAILYPLTTVRSRL